MKKILVLVTMVLFLCACVDKKAEEKKTTELNEKIEAVDQQISEEVESLEKEAQEIDSAISELDNL